MTKDKPGFLTPKAIANRIKSKGLQKLRWYCQMCQKQCRDENGYKCHIMSESHHRQIKIFAENGGKFISSFSSDFLKGYLDIVRRQFGGRRVHSNVVYQEYIKDKDHIHMNATRWHTLTGLCMWLGKQGICKVDETEKGWFLEYIDRDPEKMKRQEMNERLEKTEDEINRLFLERQIQHNLAMCDDAEAPVHTPLIRESDDQLIRLNISLGSKTNAQDFPKEQDTNKSTFEEESSISSDNTVLATSNSLIKFGLKKEKIVNPLLLAEKKARKEKTKQTSDKPKVNNSAVTNAGSRRRALDELMEKEEAFKDKRNRREFWLSEGIEVKLIHRNLPDNVRLKHAVVTKMLDKFTGLVQILDSGVGMKVDQKHVQTVIPDVSSTIRIVNGAYRGEYATLEQVDKSNYTCEATLITGLCMGRLLKNLSFDDVCKLAEVKR